MANSPRSQDIDRNQVLLCGRILVGCLLMAAVLLVWTQQYAYHENERHRLRDPSASSINDYSSDGASQYEEEPSSSSSTAATFSCRIDQLQLELSYAPDLIIAGAAKCGTTTIAHWLLDHPSVLPTKRWEQHFFNTQIHPREFEPLLSTKNNNTSSDPHKRENIICELRKRYLHQWPDLRNPHPTRVYTFDKTPDYLYPSRVPALIRALFENSRQRPKIVILLRNPIDRAYSHYRMGQRLIREEHVSFEEFIQREIKLLQELGLTNFVWNHDVDDNHNPHETTITTTTSSNAIANHSMQQMDQLYDQVSDQLKGHNYLSRGLYAMQLERWFRHGLGSNILVLPYPELAFNPDRVYSKILQFANMPPHDLPQDLLNTRFNYNDAITDPLRNSTRLQLTMFYKQANQELMDLLAKYNKSQEYDWQQQLMEE